MSKDDIIICRCSDISLSKLEELVEEGFTTLDEIKRISRMGMGPCRGNTCLELAAREICRLTGKKMDEVLMPSNRPPLTGIKMAELAGEFDDKK